MIHNKFPSCNYYFLILLITLLNSCRPEIVSECNVEVLVTVAHPDDETLISGTLAKLINRGCDVTVVYTTSGDDGPDMTGRELQGNALAQVREKEAHTSLDHIGVVNPPVFLKFPDGKVWENSELIRDTLILIFNQLNPCIIITFGPDGVTDDLDHITTGQLTDQVFNELNIGTLLLHMAISRIASKIYPIPAPVDDDGIDLRVNVADFKRERMRSNNAHRTQFGLGQRLFWRLYVRRYQYEEFAIIHNKEGEQLLQFCF